MSLPYIYPATTANAEVLATDFVLHSPDGKILKITREAFEALAMFVGPGLPAGQITIDCNRGAIAGVSVRLKLK